MTHWIRVVAIPTEKKIIETRHDDPRQALLAALGEIPQGYTVASVEVDPSN
jgi:hypothetical protein